MPKAPPFKMTLGLWLLCGLYPVLLFCSTNWYAFAWPQIGFLLSSIPSAMLAAGALWHLLCRLYPGRRDGRTSPTPSLLMGLPPLILMGILLKEPLSGIPVSGWKLAFAITVLTVLLGVLLHRKGLRPVVLMMLFLNGAALAHFGYGILRYLPEGNRLWYTRERARFEKVVLKQRPNIYFILAESYPSRKHLETCFHVKNGAFYRRLENWGFHVNHAFLSNYNYTLASLSSILTMTHHRLKIAVGDNEAVSAREIISGLRYNPVLDILKRNGYYIQYLHQTDYQLRKGAEVDFYAPRYSLYQALKYFWHPVSEHRTPEIPDETFLDLIRQRIRHAAALSQPAFTYIYTLWPGHSPTLQELKNPSDASDTMEAFFRGYPKRLEHANAFLSRILETIRQIDGDAVIVLCGDHGPWALRRFHDVKGALDPEQFCQDIFGVLAAVRWPFKENAEAVAGIKTSVNLFRTLFALLSRDRALLEDKEADEGYRHGKLFYRNGRVLEVP